MVILGVIPKPENFVVLTADPGMENSKTYEYIEMMKDKCGGEGIEFYVVEGPNLYDDILNLGNTDKIRFDTPPYWVKIGDRKKEGRLLQGCTQVYKIYPMDRKIRDILATRFGISRKSTRLGDNIVEKWVGFSYSEIERVKPSNRKYSYFRYPLIDLKMNNDDVNAFFINNNLPIPPRSVCNACFANGLDTLKEMYYKRPKDWEQAVLVDDAVRDWSQIGVKNPVFVSKTLFPLSELAHRDFDLDNTNGDLENQYSCDSGYCFL
jgi:hypothetical protein